MSLSMLLTSLIVSTSFHAFYYNCKVCRRHDHFLLYFGLLFAGELALAWMMLWTVPQGHS